MAFKIVFDAYHLYHLPQFEPVIELLKNDDRFEIILTTSAENHKSERNLTESILRSMDLEVIFADTEEQRGQAIQEIEPDVFICGWSRYSLRKFVAEHTIVGMIYHGIGVKPSYWRDNHSRLNIRFVEGPLREKQLQNAGITTELFMSGFTKLDPLFNVEKFNRDLILKELSLDPLKKTVLYAPTFYPSSLKQLLGPLSNTMEEYNVIIKPHSWVFFPEAFTGVNLQPQTKLLKSLNDNKNVAVLSPERYNIVPYLYCSDILVTEASSTIFEMMALDKPVIMCTFYSLKWNHRLFKNRLYNRRLNKEMSEGMTDFCILLDEPNDLQKTVQLSLGGYDPHPKKREFYKKDMLFDLDGRASVRVRDQLLKKLNAA